MVGPSAGSQTTPPVTPQVTPPVTRPQPTAPDAVSSTDAKTAPAAKPVARGASGVTTTPEAVAREKHKAALLAQLATPKAQKAETACDILEDARIGYAEINPDTATPRQIHDAKLRLEKAQVMADAAVADNLKEQKALNKERRIAMEKALVEEQKYKKDHPGGPNAKELADKAYWAEADYYFSEEKVAVAMSLRDIANGTRPGRAELARDTRLEHAEAAQAWLYAVQHALDSGKFSDGVIVQRLIEEYGRAASANRAEWAAANQNAIKSGDAALQKKTSFGLTSAEHSLATVPQFKADIVKWR